MILAGVLTFVLVANALRSRDATVEVAVAAHDVAAGAVMTPEATTTAKLPASSSLRGNLIAPDTLRDGAMGGHAANRCRRAPAAAAPWLGPPLPAGCGP